MGMLVTQQLLQPEPQIQKTDTASTSVSQAPTVQVT